MFSVHIGDHNLLTEGFNLKIHVLVNCVSVKFHTSFDEEVCINVGCAQTHRNLYERIEMCVAISVYTL